MRGGCRWRAVVELVREGKNPEERIDQSVKKTLYYKFRLGLFENRYTAQPAADSGPVLPLAAPERIFVTGTNADNQTILGDWAMKQSDENVVTVLRGIREAAPAGSQIDYLDIGSGF